MKSTLIVIFISTFFYSLSQINQNELIGVWQSNSQEMSSAYLETYQFFENGSFKFNTNQYDGLRRVICIGGNFKVSKNSISLKITYIVENEGGSIAKDELTTLNNSWSIKGGEIKKKELAKSVLEVISIEKTNLKDSISLYFDGQIYYKILSDPSKW